MLILGGGVAGLFLLDELERRGFDVMLVECRALGDGQTIASQGIVHGGLKYVLSGLMNASAEAVSRMPSLWHDCLAGRCPPDLSAVDVLSRVCYLWRTESVMSRIGLLGARAGLHTPVNRVAPEDRPEVLGNVPGEIYSVEEPVIDVGSLVRAFADRHRGRIIGVGSEAAMAIERSGPGVVRSVMLEHPDGRREAFQPSTLVFCAGGGNAALRDKVGLSAEAMQRRPLHMVMARGRLHPLFGHCVDGNRTRVTITSVIDSAGRTVWYVGGQLSEDGVHLSELGLIRHARRELGHVVRGVDLSDTEWATFRIDRAESRQQSGQRPEGPTCLREGNCLTAWPTKLALAPALAERIAGMLPPPRGSTDGAVAAVSDWPRPELARPPWEQNLTWRR